MSISGWVNGPATVAAVSHTMPAATVRVACSCR
jgi:hypothetical protein